MRITGVRIYGFGCWVDQEFSFQTDYQVIVGDNESGKTTLLAFIYSVLFGFADGHQKYRQYLPRKSSKYGGEVCLVADSDQWLVRRTKTGTKQELTVLKNQQEVSLEQYQALLSPMTAKLFMLTNYLDRNTVDQVLKLTDEQLMERIMAIGAVGAQDWLPLAKQFRHRAQEIYRPQGRKPPLNLLLKESINLKKQFQIVQDQKQQFQQLAQQLTELDVQRTALAKKTSQQETNERQQQKLLQKWPDYQEWRQLQSQNSEKVVLDTDWDQFNRLQERIRTLHQQEQNLQVKLASAKELPEELLKFQERQDRWQELLQDWEKLNYQQTQQIQGQQQLHQLQEQQRVLVEQEPYLRQRQQPLTKAAFQEWQQLQNHPRNRSQEQAPPASGWLWGGLGLLVLGLGASFMTQNWWLLIIAFLGIGLGAYSWSLTKGAKSAALQLPADSEEKFQQRYQLTGLATDRVNSWQLAAQQWTELAREIAKVEQEKENYQQQLQNWQEQVQVLLPKTIAPSQFKNYYQTCQQKLLAWQQEQAQQQQLSQQLAQQQRELLRQETALKELLQRYGVLTAADLRQLRDKNQQQQEYKQRLAVLTATLQPDLKSLQAVSQVRTIQDQLRLQQQQLKSSRKQQEKLRQQETNLLAQQQRLANDRQYQDLQQKIENNKTEIEIDFGNWLSFQLAADWIQETLNQASSNRLPHLLTRAQVFFEELTAGHYQKLQFRKGQLTVLTTDGIWFAVAELSRGTMVQLFLALNLAFVLEVADLTTLPLLLDDVLVDFDESRRQIISRLLPQIASTTQVIYASTSGADFPATHVLQLKGGKTL
ncbi:AAA family ATPase [Lactobacillus sp. DCY120]|uniref:AAA family ATPase n=1 Tax=Bombilactobacillus apium TaxID=2675299 RepID=A0A850R8L7_9LACO|nr:AAA family ATPase [Bombilactobacillus apium]NVY96875.1 AAA family ATPase [Bombilactobacillus apium]